MIFSQFSKWPSSVKQYAQISLNYWFFTLTDGALRMLVVLYFYQLGYTPLAIAMLFLFYEVFGVVTNLVGGWLATKIGLNRTMNIGLFLQVFALLMLTVPAEYLTVFWVMLAQALSGIAKDLNKMSAKSSIKFLVPKNKNSMLFRWVAILTGSKNTLKGIGFFLGSILLSVFGFRTSLLLLAIVLLVIAVISTKVLNTSLGKVKIKAKFSQLFSKHHNLNYLSAARMCLFAARDVWFVVALPVYLSAELQWQHHYIGAFMAIWIIAYGLVQVVTPKFIKFESKQISTSGLLFNMAIALAMLTLVIAGILASSIKPDIVIGVGLFSFGVIFAVNSAIHSYAIVAIADDESTSMDVGFYYMGNALGRLIGTILSGWVYQVYGIEACLTLSIVMILLSAIFVKKTEIN